MGIWLISAVVLQLACAVCAARLERPTIWLQIILLVPLFGSLAYCAFEFMKRLAPADLSPWATRQEAHEPVGSAMDGLCYQAVRAQTVESRRALAEECMRVGRHADARLLFESCLLGRNARDPRLIRGLEQATALMAGSADRSR